MLSASEVRGPRSVRWYGAKPIDAVSCGAGEGGPGCEQGHPYRAES